MTKLTDLSYLKKKLPDFFLFQGSRKVCPEFQRMPIREQYKKAIITKGHIISEQNCRVLDFPKKQRKYFKDL